MALNPLNPIPLALNASDISCLWPCCNTAPFSIIYINQQFKQEKPGILATICNVLKGCICCGCCPDEDAKEANRRMHTQIRNNCTQSIQLILPGDARTIEENETYPLLEKAVHGYRNRATEGAPLTEEEFWAISAAKASFIAQIAHDAAELINTSSQMTAAASESSSSQMTAAASESSSSKKEIHILLPSLKTEVHKLKISLARETIIKTLRPLLEGWGYANFTDRQIYILYRILIQRSADVDLPEQTIELIVALFRNSPLPRTALEELVPQMSRWVRVRIRAGGVTIVEARTWLENKGYFIAKDVIISLLIEQFTLARHHESADPSYHESADHNNVKYITDLMTLSLPTSAK